MTAKKFIEFLDKNDARYYYINHRTAGDVVCVFSKEECDKRKKHPRKYKDIKVPTIRISRFKKDKVFTAEYVQSSGCSDFPRTYSWVTYKELRENILNNYVKKQ